MPANYNGNTTGLSGRPTVTISEPVGTDTRNAASVQTPLRKIADFVQYLMTNAALLGANVFTATQQIASGGLDLTQAALQSILKKGSGKLQLGTATGNNSDLELLINGVVKAILRASDGKLQGQSTVAGDGGTTLASKDYVESYTNAKFGVTWTALTLGGGWTGNASYWKDSSGVVRLKGSITGLNSGFATFPAGARPGGERRFAVPSSTASQVTGFAMVYVYPAGGIGIGPVGGETLTYYLDGVSFVAEQ
jgi:hypothetical protein